MKPRRQVTLKEIARRAGVATGTVSMVLNDSPRVAVLTRARVRKVIDELGYVYNRGAAQMRNKRTNIVGVSICNLVNPYFAQIASEIEQSLDARGQVLFLGNCRESVDRQARFLSTLRQYNVEGVLLMPAIGTPKEAVEQLAAWRIPTVMVSRRVAGASIDFVGNDNRLGTLLATNYLLGLAHRRVGFVGLNRRTSTARERAAGYQSALVATGIAVEPDLIVECDATREEGFRAVSALFRRKRPPTAIVCFNDLIAFGVMLGLRHMGLEPGRDCSVTGFDDVDEAALWQPQLTTVAIDIDKIGGMAAELLRARIDDPKRAVEQVSIAPRLVVRSSCGPAPKPSRSAARK